MGKNQDYFEVNVVGPGIMTSIDILCKEDLEIILRIIEKIKSQFLVEEPVAESNIPKTGISNRMYTYGRLGKRIATVKKARLYEKPLDDLRKYPNVNSELRRRTLRLYHPHMKQTTFDSLLSAYNEYIAKLDLDEHMDQVTKKDVEQVEKAIKNVRTLDNNLTIENLLSECDLTPSKLKLTLKKIGFSFEGDQIHEEKTKSS